jgi:DNA-binding MarR family transcriptional regulator
MIMPSYKNNILITRAYRLVRAKSYTYLSEHDLNATEWSIIGLVFESASGITLSDVAKSIEIKKPLVTLLVDKLAKRKLIERIPNKADSRSKLLVIMPEGEALIQKIETDIEKSFSELFANLTTEEIDTYFKVLETIISND